MNTKTNRTGMEIAVIGMTGRFPGAKNIDEFWENLKQGKESITFFTDEELKEAGVPPALLQNPNYVKANGILENFDRFDASFFGYIPSEAAIMAPQIRLFHECVWEGLEHAGYNPETYSGRIGLYAGATSSSRWETIAYLSEFDKKKEKNQAYSFSLELFSNSQLTDKDNLTTRISYKFNLTGPSFSIHTACSTSLVAVHLAVQGLINGECEIAVAGGISLNITQRTGYLYQEGGILSPDGHNRAFDAKAKGTVSGDGTGVVILKLLEDAETDGDYIHAVIKGSAINNDGNRKVGYTAPSVEGQAKVISTALYVAQVDPESITYVEAHGTGTELGDPVEVSALKLAFGNLTKKRFCALGSVKSNIGHLITAAGVAGLIKTVLALKNGLIPPSLHFESPNTKIDFENSPFYVNTELREWRCEGYTRRAGVSAFGIGGTNAHIVLEEYIKPEDDTIKGALFEKTAPLTPTKTFDNELILLSARTENALEKATENLFSYFKKNPNTSLPDAAYTMQVGRKHFNLRRTAICSTNAELLDVLAPENRFKTRTYAVTTRLGKKQPVAFLFPGQGAQYITMGLDLYRKEPLFRQIMDRCFEVLNSLMHYDLKQVLYPSLEDHPVSKPYETNIIDRTEIAQPMIFAFEYALASLLISWGMEPDAMLGHSIGEYTAACLAGVFSLEDALKLVMLRGQLMQQMPGGSMLSVAIPEEQLKLMLTGDMSNLSLAAVNSPSRCVVSGPHDVIAAFEAKIKAEGIECTQLHTSHAFHSGMMDPILELFKEKIGTIALHKPVKPYIANLNGRWITAGEAIDPTYWTDHLRRTVRFSDGVKLLLEKDDFIFIEVGPGNSLTTLVKQHAETSLVINLVRRPKETSPDDRYLLDKIGQLWLYGISVNWNRFHRGQKRYRIPLPTYPFESLRFPTDKDLSPIKSLFHPASPELVRRPQVSDWVYAPLWEQSIVLPHKNAAKKDFLSWLVFSDNSRLALRLQAALESLGYAVNVVETGTGFLMVKEKKYTVNPGCPEDYNNLFNHLVQAQEMPQRIVQMWNMDVPAIDTIEENSKEKSEGLNEIDNIMDLGFYSLLHIVTALDKSGAARNIQLDVIASCIYRVNENECIQPLRATLPAALKTIQHEFPYISCRCIDIIPPPPGGTQEDKLVENLVTELSTIGLNGQANKTFEMAAWRGANRWVQHFKPYHLEDKVNPGLNIKEKGVYLITGGLGGIGLVFARSLAMDFKARLVLIGRSSFPQEEQWEEWLNSHGDTDPVSIKIRELREMLSAGAQVIVASADVSNLEEMQVIINTVEQRFGPINGLIHAAGSADYEGVILRRTRHDTEKILAPKIKGTIILDYLLRNKPLDFAILCSSLSFVLGPKGQVGYNAANAFQDAFAHAKAAVNPGVWISIAWAAWQVGMAVEAIKKQNRFSESFLEEGISPSEGINILYLLLEHPLSQAAICPVDLELVIKRMDMPEEKITLPGKEMEPEKAAATILSQRPSLSVEYVAARDFFERALADNWQKYFGLEKIGIYDDFFELGGDSLKAMSMIANIQKEMDVIIPLGIFFEKPNINALATYIRNKTVKDLYSSIENVEEKEFYDLSRAQKRLFIQQQEEPASIVYNLTSFYILEGNFNFEKMDVIFNELINRHESLRTSFELREMNPVQKIHDDIEIKIEKYENEKVDQSVFNIDHFIQVFVRSFDLARAPLLHVGFVELAQKKYLLMIDIHHIISDGISMTILLSEFKKLYKGESLPVLTLQYKDYSHWQNLRLSSGEIKRQEEFWLKEFAGELPLMRLPLDYPRGELRSFLGNRIDFMLDREVNVKLRELANEEEVTLFILLTAIYYIFLFKLTGQEDIVIGTVSAGRGHADLEKIIGMFVNTLAIRNFPRQDRRFNEFLAEVKKRTLDAFENQDYQFEDLVGKLLPYRDNARNPLFDTVITYIPKGLAIEAPESKLGDRDLKISEYNSVGEVNTLFDLVLGVFDWGEKIGFSMQYNIQLFKQSTIERFVGYFKKIVHSILENKTICIREIEVSHDLQSAQSNIYNEMQMNFEF